MVVAVEARNVLACTVEADLVEPVRAGTLLDELQFLPAVPLAAVALRQVELAQVQMVVFGGNGDKAHMSAIGIGKVVLVVLVGDLARDGLGTQQVLDQVIDFVLGKDLREVLLEDVSGKICQLGYVLRFIDFHERQFAHSAHPSFSAQLSTRRVDVFLLPRR